MTREVYVVGNWKMYKTAREATDYIEKLIPKLGEFAANIYLAVPFTSIALAASFSKQTKIVIGAQNMNDAREGAFTGEIAGLMLKEAGAAFVLLGHSERRRLFHETDEIVHRKVIRALQDDIQPILCIGETLEERNAGHTEKVLERQLTKALFGISKEDAARVILAYEPVWAIGTGKSATADMAEEAHAFCRHVLDELFGKKAADGISILYGGSVNKDTAFPIVKHKNIDGFLVGGASLDVDTFAAIAAGCHKKEKK